MRLVESLERYLGQGNVPGVPDVKTRKPSDWSVERYCPVVLCHPSLPSSSHFRWLRFRCDALQGFFDDLRHPRRGLVSFTSMNSSSTAYPQAATASGGGVLDNPNVTLRSNFQPTSTSQKANEDFTFEGVYGNRHDDEPVYESYHSTATSSAGKLPMATSLIDALVPLNIFLRTDCVKIFIPSADSKEEVLIKQTNYDPSSSYASHTDPTISDWKIVLNGKLIEPFPPTPQLMQDYLDFLGEPGLTRPRFFPPFPEFSLEDPKSYSDDEIMAAGQ
jgi:hypothetical protein